MNEISVLRLAEVPTGLPISRHNSWQYRWLAETRHQHASESFGIADLLGGDALVGLLLKLATAVATHNVAQATARGGCVKLCAKRIELLNGLREGADARLDLALTEGDAGEQESAKEIGRASCRERV